MVEQSKHEQACSREWAMQKAIDIFKTKKNYDPDKAFPKILDAAKKIASFYENKADAKITCITTANKRK